jgi:rsbT co-antagonist protein RsbR
MTEHDATTKLLREYEDRIAALTEQLAESERTASLLRAVMNNAPAMLYQWVLLPDGKARFTFVSEACTEIYGISSNQFLVDTLFGIQAIHSDDLPSFTRAVEESARTLEPFVWEGRIVLPSQPVKWIRAFSRPHRLPDGGTCWEGAVVDFTVEHNAAVGLLASEREKSALIEQLEEQNQRLSRQAAELRVLSTPIIPLAHDVLALPIVGDINPSRAQQILESVLASVTAKGAQFVLIDITGVPTVDSYAAEALVRTAGALRLLGATAILTGVQPNTAKALIELGADLSSLITRSTFQDGMAFTRSKAARRV